MERTEMNKQRAETPVYFTETSMHHSEITVVIPETWSFPSIVSAAHRKNAIEKPDRSKKHNKEHELQS